MIEIHVVILHMLAFNKNNVDFNLLFRDGISFVLLISQKFCCNSYVTHIRYAFIMNTLVYAFILMTIINCIFLMQQSLNQVDMFYKYVVEVHICERYWLTGWHWLISYDKHKQLFVLFYQRATRKCILLFIFYAF